MADLLELLQAIDEERPVDIGERIALMQKLNRCADLAHSMAKELSMGLAKELESRGMKAESFGRYTIERKTQATRRWDNSKLLARVIEYADDQGCELHGLVQKLAAFSYWRVTELKKLGFDPEAFCDTTWSSPTVIVIDGGSTPDHEG